MSQKHLKKNSIDKNLTHTKPWKIPAYVNGINDEDPDFKIKIAEIASNLFKLYTTRLLYVATHVARSPCASLIQSPRKCFKLRIS